MIMSDGPTNLTIAQATQEKFEQYAIALTFTILGLSIQTARFDVSLVAGCLEILSWLSLLGSGLFGLWRWERAQGIYKKFHQHDEMKQRAMTTGKALLSGVEKVHGLLDGTTVRAKEYFENEKQIVAKLEEVIEKANAAQVWRYHLQKGLFVGGLIGLVIARAYVPVVHIVTVILHHLGG